MTALQKLQAALEVFRSHDELITSQRIEVFVLVALRMRISREDVKDELGLSMGGAYRNLMALTDQTYATNWGRKQGIGLLTVEDDPVESRRKSWILSPKGKRVAGQLKELLA